MDYEQIEAMVAVLKETPRLTELEVRSGDTVLRLRRPPPRHKKAEKPGRDLVLAGADSTITANSGDTIGTNAPTVPLLSGQVASKSSLVTAHLVGVFRGTRNVPITPGNTVTAGQSLGHIEAMRLMNDVATTTAGRVQAVFVQEGQPVEYGQPLFEIVPEGVS